jgi:hypothetical protein
MANFRILIPVVSTVPLLTHYNIQTSTRKHIINNFSFSITYVLTLGTLFMKSEPAFLTLFTRVAPKLFLNKRRKHIIFGESSNLKSTPNRLWTIILLSAHNTLLKHILINLTHVHLFCAVKYELSQYNKKLLSTRYYCDYVCYLLYNSICCLLEKVLRPIHT